MTRPESYSSRLRAFDLAEEAQSVRAAYGDNNFGAGCLMARRLVESGVRYVEVVLDGWDTHKNNFDRTRELSGVLDPAFATLLDELGARDLLDRTLVVCMGEFGRTPKINENDGRDHYPQAWSAVLAGGGVRGGVVVGATSDEGDKVVTRPRGSAPSARRPACGSSARCRMTSSPNARPCPRRATRAPTSGP